MFLLYSKDGCEEEKEDNALILDHLQNITFSIKSSLLLIDWNQGCWSFKTSKRTFFFVCSVSETNTLLENKTCDADSHCSPFSFRFSENENNLIYETTTNIFTVVAFKSSANFRFALFPSWNVSGVWSPRLILLLGSWYLENRYIQGGRTWQPFAGGKNGHENFRQARIHNFLDKCVVFARNRKFANLTQ